MGEIADMMLEGQMCQGCGEILGDGDGYPTFCGGCQSENGINELGETASDTGTTTKDGKPIRRPGKTNCPQCNKLVKIVGLDQHIKDVHNNG